MPRPEPEEFGLATFTRHADGSVTVDAFPPKMLLADEFLHAAEPTYVTVDDGVVTFRVTNATATYRLLGQRPLGVWEAERIDG